MTWRRRLRAADNHVPAQAEPIRIDPLAWLAKGLRIDVDHQVSHTYGKRPAPEHVTLEFRAVDTNEQLGRHTASFPGYVVRVPRWVLARATEHGADELDIVVTW